MTRLRALWEYLRGTYWAVPSAMAVLSTVLSVGMVQLDQAATARLLDRWSWVFTGGPEGARAVLSTVASSMITVAGVTFSITIVALTLASQQYGPRLLRNFLRDLGNQVVLGTFVSTFLYCLLVLRTVRGSDDEEFVPHLAVTVGVMLAMLSLVVLIFFIHHVATSIRASTIIANVADDLQSAIVRLFPDRLPDSTQPATPPSDSLAALPRAGFHLPATTAGYVQGIDLRGLVHAASERNVVVRVWVRPGAFVGPGQILLSMVPPPGNGDAIDERLRRSFIIGRDRSGVQDITFFMDQLVELAVRALSPGINDPGTARLCVDRLQDAMCQLAGRQPPPVEHCDREGQARVVTPRLVFADLLDHAFGELASHARTDARVTCRLLEAVQQIGTCVRRQADRHALERQAVAIAEGASPRSRSDRERVAESRRIALTSLGSTDDQSRR